MAVSVFDLFSVGIGPSSSHTVGPMRAARTFAQRLAHLGVLPEVERVTVELFGSLAATGRAHGTDTALLLGLHGERADEIDPDQIPAIVARIRARHRLALLGEHDIDFDESRDVRLERRATLPRHSNALRFCAFGTEPDPLFVMTAYSVGGGFVRFDGDEQDVVSLGQSARDFHSADELLGHCRDASIAISEFMFERECERRSAADVRAYLLHLWSVMQACVARGLEREGTLPGFLAVPRRAPQLARELTASATANDWASLEWLNCFALAVSEENAAGGRIVTAPTNGAAGIIPAVLHYYQRFVPGASEDGIVAFLLAAGAIGSLCKENASISGAEVGCQGEVGSACAMAAAGLAEALGGSPEQVENAAEIGIEHNLGLTCDPIGGLVQVPCIERNAMGAVKAVNAARIALRGDGSHVVSLDKALQTMRATGADMKTKYKETARGGLAVSITEC